MKKYDVIALGELLIDFTENGISDQGNPIMEANPGGAPCNVLSMLSKLGHKTAFIGKVGNDMFGHLLEQALIQNGIETEGLMKDDQIHTTLAFVHTLPDGDRSFSFYRNPGADMMVTEEEVMAKNELIANCRIFHFGSLSMTHDGCRRATQKAVELAKAAGALISFDPNLREALWDSLENAREQIAWGLSQSDIVKISDNEIRWFTGEADYTVGAKGLQEKYPNIKLLLVSLGKEGSFCFATETYAYKEAFLLEETIETTGAGDCFCGCVLHDVLERQLDCELEKGAKSELPSYTTANLEELLAFANAAAALVTTKKGALSVMPELKEIYSFLESKKQYIHMNGIEIR